jgi:thioredoxin 1
MSAQSHVKHLNDLDFDAEVLSAPGTVLVDFGATWCGPCKMLAPIVAKIAEERADTLTVAEVDIDDAPNVAARYGIRSAPTLLVFRGGQKVAQHVGLTTRQRILDLVDR